MLFLLLLSLFGWCVVTRSAISTLYGLSVCWLVGSRSHNEKSKRTTEKRWLVSAKDPKDPRVDGQTDREDTAEKKTSLRAGRANNSG